MHVFLLFNFPFSSSKLRNNVNVMSFHNSAVELVSIFAIAFGVHFQISLKLKSFYCFADYSSPSSIDI